MRFGVLGPLIAVDGGDEVTPTAPKQRQMLALLLLNANHVVSMAQLVEELWEYNPPSSAVAAVHTYIMQLRRTLHGRDGAEAAPDTRLVTREQGYVLLTRPSGIDLNVYERRVREALAALDAGLLAEGAEQIRSAQRMWRGRILAEVRTGPLLRTRVALIERDRLDVTSRRIDAELRLGRHQELLSELCALVHENLTHESLTEQLMLALYRSGRQVHALDAFHRLRRALREELGTVPTRRLYQLNNDILAAHPRLEPPSDSPGWLSLDLPGTASRVPRPPALRSPERLAGATG